VLGFLVTMDGKQGADFLKLIRPRLAIPIHFNDYDVFTSPLSDFEQEVAEAGWQDRVHYLSHGGTFTFHTPSKRAAA
jgi:L-ascorbate metabolism protein UlaG (beta-lactamase superfamily)